MPHRYTEARSLRRPSGRSCAHWTGRSGGERVLSCTGWPGGAGGCSVPLHHSQAQASQPQNLRSGRSPAPCHLRQKSSSRLHLLSLRKLIKQINQVQQQIHRLQSFSVMSST
ncbi:hypothetical protein SAY87_008488 [Trapa incisa]|uniref:Uncharacterized protein n=1 Tax=Trapa incisa TaxID=236973 RepID=A0AAN7JV01_9MYRT|nr:hypothetical protein SAY87_008488 [Trapa incisa]